MQYGIILLTRVNHKAILYPLSHDDRVLTGLKLSAHTALSGFFMRYALSHLCGVKWGSP